MTLIIYCKDHRRRPVRFGYPSISRDTQADIPLSWCCQCGSEVFDRGQTKCIQCRNKKGETEDE